MAELVRQCRASVAWTHKNAADHGGDPERIYITGHSAGGHVTAMMMATDWDEWDVPKSSIKGGFAISGLYDLEPIRLNYMNPTLGFTEATVRDYSPMHLDPQLPSAALRRRNFCATIRSYPMYGAPRACPAKNWLSRTSITSPCWRTSRPRGTS